MTTFEGVATASLDINAPPARVWQALTDPALVRQYLYGAEIDTDWQVGSPVTFTGEYNGKPYADKGTILAIEPGKLLKWTHYSPLSGHPDLPENYHVVTYELSENGDQTRLTIRQENNRDQAEADGSQEFWATILGNIKTLLEA